MTTNTARDLDALCEDVRRVAGAVVDPEIPVLSIVDLGILRDVVVAGDRVEVLITPTYTGCPAMNAIKADIERAVADAHLAPVSVKLVWSPAWTTDWITDRGRQRLLDYGIAPPVRGQGRPTLFGRPSVACPRCGSHDTEPLAAFGSTACKALWRCLACREPFDYFKCH